MIDIPPHPWLIAGLAFCVAFLYSSVGFGGASGYLAVMSLFNITARVASTTALVLNVCVAGVAFANYYRHGYLRWRLLWPFLITSIPAAFVGGALPVKQLTYQMLLNGILLFAGLRLLLLAQPQVEPEVEVRPPLWLMLFIGLVLGLISGIVGIGGGIFLSPLIVLARWGTAKLAAACAAGFIVLNSVSGLVGRASGGMLDLGSLGVILIPIGFIGGLLGSYLGAHYLGGRGVQRLLGIILLIVALRFWLGR